MSRQSVLPRTSLINQDPEGLIKNLIFGDANAIMNRRRGTLREVDLIRNISMIKVEYLSLRNTSLKNINFLKYFINLWYLDIRDNPVK
jgi:hypothetical protein